MSALVPVSLLAGVWALLYSLYRGYYAFGGTVGMIGTPVSWSQWRLINLAGAVVILTAAVLTVIAIPLWRRPHTQRILLAFAWVATVFCVGHALVQDVQRVASLAGLFHIHYSASEWVSVNRHKADIQDLAFNESWFIVEGLLWATLAWIVLGRSRLRRWWLLTAAVAVALFTMIGLLSAFGIVGRLVIG